MNKRTAKELRLLAAKIPPTFYTVKRTEKVSGKVLIQNGVERLSDGTQIAEIDEKGNDVYYNSTFDVNRPVNHFLRMKRIHIKYGIAQVLVYVSNEMALFEESTKPKEIGGLQTENY